jgi:hypothetical protein
MVAAASALRCHRLHSMWETAFKQKGETDRHGAQRSPDGRSLSVNIKGPKPSGGTFDSTRIYERVSGGSFRSGPMEESLRRAPVRNTRNQPLHASVEHGSTFWFRC